MTDAAQRRLYFALWPDDALRAAIAAASAEAIATVGGRAVPPADFHVTLAFLGGVPAARVAPAIAAARSVRAERGAQRFDRVGSWPRGESPGESPGGPLVLEATRVAASLAALHAALGNRLRTADFALDRREFRPHITLARGTERACAPVSASVEWRYSAFVLVESRLAPAGSRYAIVDTFPLG